MRTLALLSVAVLVVASATLVLGHLVARAAGADRGDEVGRMTTCDDVGQSPPRYDYEVYTSEYGFSAHMHTMLIDNDATMDCWVIDNGNTACISDDMEM